LKSVANDPITATMTTKKIRTTISKRFQVDNVDFINQAKDIKIEIKKKNRKKQIIINLSYEVKAHLMGNIFVVGDFSDNVFEVQNH